MKTDIAEMMKVLHDEEMTLDDLADLEVVFGKQAISDFYSSDGDEAKTAFTYQDAREAHEIASEVSRVAFAAAYVAYKRLLARKKKEGEEK